MVAEGGFDERTQDQQIRDAAATDATVASAGGRQVSDATTDKDLEDFVKSGRMLDVAEESMCCEYRMTSTMEGASKVDGTVVMANEPQVCSMGDGTWAWEEYERINSYGNWWESRGIKGTSDFGSYTGEQVLAFLEEPIIKRLVNNEMVE